jgi:hypothetical protein
MLGNYRNEFSCSLQDVGVIEFSSRSNTLNYI